LGLEAQQAALACFAEVEGFTFRDTYQEVECAKGDAALERRPQLAAAIKAARKLGPADVFSFLALAPAYLFGVLAMGALLVIGYYGVTGKRQGA
jgi:hypothetical protein